MVPLGEASEPDGWTRGSREMRALAGTKGDFDAKKRLLRVVLSIDLIVRGGG